MAEAEREAMTVDHITRNPTERLLWAKWQANPSDDLRNRILAFYDGLALTHAHAFITAGRMAGMSFGDLYSEGWVGLCAAFDSFDTTRGVLFYTHASERIIGAIKHALRDKGNQIRLPGWRIEAGDVAAEIDVIDDYLDPPADTPSVDAMITHLALTQALAKLPYRERETVIACDLEGYTQQETANMHDWSVITSFRARKRGLNKLHSLLQLSLAIMP
jgi:RNA polymerase sigma factor (sigma-70 family)